MKKLTFVALSVLALSGCKVDVSTEVNLDDVQSHEHKLAKGDINFEVSSCKDFEDSRIESKSLKELKETIPSIVRGAQFVECYDKRMDSFAHFTVPVGVGRFGEQAKEQDADIYIFSQGDILAGVYMDKNLIQKIKKHEKDAIGSFDFSISVKVNSDGKPETLKVIGAFMKGKNFNNHPAIVQNLEWKGKDPITFSLSDVSIESLMRNGSVPFLVENNT
ncbi:hypothetical protein SBO61_30755, partial [Bacillus thuringiensis]